MTDKTSLRAAELELQEAQVRSDIATLDRLLHDKLTFVSHDGSLSGKAWDIEIHDTGALRLDSLVAEDVLVNVIDGVGITVLTARFEGKHDDEEFDTRLRFTRTWVFGENGWQVVAQHASVLNPTVN